MSITMDADSTIYAAIESMLKLIPRDKAIITRVEIDVTLKENYEKTARGHVHFLFTKQRGTYIQVYFAMSDEFGMSELITDWTRSANNDGVQVVGHQGIGGPLWKMAEKLLAELKSGWKDCNVEASWPLGAPEVVSFTEPKKISKKEFDRRYKIIVRRTEHTAAV